MAKVAILGAGAYGTALGGILAENGYDIDYYDPNVERERLKDVVSDAQVMLLCIPSDIVMKLLFHLPKNVPLVVASKGFLSEKPFSGFRDWAVLSGASFADDVKMRKTIHLTATDERIVQMFHSCYVKFDTTDDKLGVLMCGALKNVYAIRAGELNLKTNTKKKEDYIYNVVKEMAVILRENSAKPNTIRLACGMKDLILTCDPNSRNYQFGQIIKNGITHMPEMTVEGLATISRIKRGDIIVPESAVILRSIIEASNGWLQSSRKE